MTNNDEMALKLNWLARKAKFGHFDLQEFLTEANPANILALLAERDADKKVISDSVVLFETLRQRIAELEAISAAAEKLVRCKGRYHSEQNYRALAALFGVATPDLPPLETEARTVSVKLPENTPLAEAPEHIWLQTAGVWPENGEFSELTWCSDNQHQDDTLYVRADLVAGINLEVGGGR